MLLFIKFDFELSVIALHTLLIGLSEQVREVFFREKGAAEDAHDLIDTSVEFKVVLNDGHQAIGDDSGVYLYAYCVFGDTPKGLDTEVLLYPLEEEFYLPTILIEKGYLTCTQKEVVGVEGQGSIEFGDISHYPTDCSGIVRCVALGGESHGLVSDDVIVFKHVFSIFNPVLGPSLFSNDKEGLDLFDTIQSGQVPIASVENVTGQRLVGYVIHGVDIIHACIGDLEEGRNLGDDIKLRVELDARLGTSELRPLEHAHTKVYGGGVEGVEFAFDLELTTYALALRQCNHVVGEILEYVIVAVVIGFGEPSPSDRKAAQPQMIRLACMCYGDICEFAQTGTALKLTEDQDEQMAPVAWQPASGTIGMGFHNAFKLALGQEPDDLAEYVLALVHLTIFWSVTSKIVISNVRQGLLKLISCFPDEKTRI